MIPITKKGLIEVWRVIACYSKCGRKYFPKRECWITLFPKSRFEQFLSGKPRFPKSQLFPHCSDQVSDCTNLAEA